MRNILLIFLFAVGFNTFAQDKSVQFTGILVSTDSLLTIPFANILIKNNEKGTISDFYGYFSLVANKGDTIIFSCLGYKQANFIIPEKTQENFITIVQKLESDTILLKETKVYPWPSRDQFKQAFLTTDIPDDDIERAKKNIDNAFVDIMIAEMPSDGKENFKDFMNDMERQQYIMSGGVTLIPILNPFAWAAFIKAWRDGDFKRKD
ncbi:MAG: carboxypeptidase-like regulatory domain-containing protein [Bacteroidota bacterium]|nr:carboxypeptidase-like regulatory domain-containing protein [Bacteroidota bacterium]